MGVILIMGLMCQVNSTDMQAALKAQHECHLYYANCLLAGVKKPGHGTDEQILIECVLAHNPSTHK